MATVSINFISVSGGWTAIVINAGISYKFAGATKEEQFENVRKLASTMEEGTESVNDSMSDLFEGINPEDSARVARELFGDTNELFYQGSLSFAAQEGDVISDLYEPAGEALDLSLLA